MLPIIYYPSRPLHLQPQHRNDYHPQLLIAAPRLAEARNSYTPRCPNETQTGPSGFLSISDNADLQLWVINWLPVSLAFSTTAMDPLSIVNTVCVGLNLARTVGSTVQFSEERHHVVII